MYKQKRKNKKFKKKEVIHPDAAGIDIGSRAHYVCVPEERDKGRIRKFGSFTGDLYSMAKWLKECGVKTVAMESTGSYWIAPFQILEEHGFDVILANARHIKNVPGRKTDVQDCQWIQELHTFGLLRGSFRPDQDVCQFRSYTRQRNTLIKSACSHVQRMQKALTQMNLQLHQVISDITGVTGTEIIEAILNGEQDPIKLAQLKQPGIKSSTEDIAKALTGDYRNEELFSLKQEYDAYKFYQIQIIECDKKIQSSLKIFQTKVDSTKKPLAKSKTRYNKKGLNYPKFDIRSEFYRMTGVDFTAVDGLDVQNLMTIISEVGIDPHKWPSEKHFASWLGLCPNNKITGDRIKSSRTSKTVNRAAIAFRLGAYGLFKSKTALGAYFRRMRKRLGTPKAITATAHKLACIFYRMLKYGTSYVDVGMDYYEKRYQDRMIRNLKQSAKHFGFMLVQKQTASGGVS